MGGDEAKGGHGLEPWALLGVRLLAIYLIIRGIEYLPGLTGLVGHEGLGWRIVLSQLFALTAPAVLGIVLFAFSRAIARRIAPAHEAEPGGVEFAELPQVVFAATGLLIAALKLPWLIFQLDTWIRASDQVRTQAEHSLLLGVVSSTAVVLLGVSMFLGARFWHGLYRRVREFGLG